MNSAFYYFMGIMAAILIIVGIIRESDMDILKGLVVCIGSLILAEIKDLRRKK